MPTKSRKRSRKVNGSDMLAPMVSRMRHTLQGQEPAVARAARDTFLDAPHNPLPLSRHSLKGVLSDELSTNLHMKH